MDAHDRFTKWAVSQGVEIHGVAAHTFPGSGVGIIAEQDTRKGDVLLSVPHSALRTAYTVPTAISQPLEGITVHGLLAAELSLDTAPARSAWRAVLPSRSDFEQSVPLLWDPALQSLLPFAAKELLSHQQEKLASDWGLVSKAFPDLSHEDYLYNWLLVNTRTFYYVKPGVRKKPANHDDRMCLQPFADYFNHSDTGCFVEFSAQGFTVKTDRSYKRGEEIYISYGNHSNDFLLAEYGFILETNMWDQIRLDDLLSSRLDEKPKAQLKEAGFLGKYYLDKEGPCYRSKVAMRSMIMPVNAWRRFVDAGNDGGEVYQVKEDELWLEMLRQFEDGIGDVEREIDDCKKGLEVQRNLLRRRWRQIRALIQDEKARLNKE